MDPSILAMLMKYMQGQSGRNQVSGGLEQFLGGIFGNSGQPFQAGMDEYSKYNQQGRDVQNPFYNAGTGAIPKYQDWLSKMQDPTKFFNDLSSGYESSPYARYQQDNSTRAANNMGSATGLTDSTPLTQFAQQNSRDISSQDQNNWLQQVLGINSKYGDGQKSLIDTGQNSANMLSQLFEQLGISQGQGAYGRAAGRNQDRSNIIGGLTNGGMGLFNM